MTTLMLQDLSDTQRAGLDAQGSAQRPARESDNPWDPDRRPSQPAIRPWWQRHDRRDQDSRTTPDPLWGRGSGPS
jgi:hypothetical protein